MYTYRFKDVDLGGRLAVWSEITAYLHTRYHAPQRVLDPAAGLGEFIMSSPAPDRWAVDMVDHGLAPETGLRIQVADIMEADLPPDYFDLIFVSNLLEHLANPDRIADLLMRLHSVLKPGGRLVVVGPNFRYCLKQYFDCADHILALTHIAVAEHLFAAGYEVESVEPKFLPYSFRSILPSSPVLTRWYLRFPILWKVLGKQFLVTGRRPVPA